MTDKRNRFNIQLDDALAARVRNAARIDERPPAVFLRRLIALAMQAVDAGELKPQGSWVDDYRTTGEEE